MKLLEKKRKTWEKGFLEIDLRGYFLDMTPTAQTTEVKVHMGDYTKLEALRGTRKTNSERQPILQSDRRHLHTTYLIKG